MPGREFLPIFRETRAAFSAESADFGRVSADKLLYLIGRARNDPNRPREQVTIAFPTGASPTPMCETFVADLAADPERDWTNTHLFDVGTHCVPPPHPDSSYSYLMRHLIEPMEVVDPTRSIPRENLHTFNGMAPDPFAECERRNEEIRQLGGLDIIVLGIGVNGHIGFNEPGSTVWNQTRRVHLAPETIDRKPVYLEEGGRAAEENPSVEAVDLLLSRTRQLCTQAYTMGIAEILKARRILLLVAGVEKTWAYGQSFRDMVDPADFPAAYLQDFKGDLYVIRDRAVVDSAASAKPAGIAPV